MVSQLSPTTAIETIYKVGDRLKLRKKPLAASHLKRGDVIQVDAIHPKDGSIKFWNERSDRWEFIYPDEVGRIIDSPTPAEVAVGESNCPPGETDTTTHVDEVGESNCPPGDIDSPTSAEVAVGESNCPPADDYLALHAISTYRPRGTARGGEYYRLSYKDGGKVRSIHIRGGNTDSPIAQARVAEVRSLLATGMSPAEVAAVLKKTANI